ncbi:MAG: hypothetical protein KGL43_14265 [Burkholderiales bacterium]|nr:hypothetical protein [Burkholderiales bacterium]MDE2454753.1 hypothetical protein [Burkholderiales bacterium]
MFQFRVTDTCLEARLASLEDVSRQRHIVRMTAALPEIGAELEGAGPGLGFHILLAVGSGRLYRVIFEAINCSEQYAFERMHGPQRSAKFPRPVLPRQIPAALTKSPSGL